MRMAAIIAVLAASLGATACETYQGRSGAYGDYAYVGREHYRGDCNAFGGRGGALLDPWLACTREGQEIVRLGFNRHRSARLSVSKAHRANVWFRRHADVDRDLRLTDVEIRTALANSAVFQRGLRR